MRHSNLHKAGATAVAGGLLLLSGTQAISFGDAGPTGLQVLGLQQTGLSLANPGLKPIKGQVVVEVAVGDAVSLMRVPFVVWGGQKVFVPFTLPTPEARVIRTGIIVDDGAPI